MRSRWKWLWGVSVGAFACVLLWAHGVAPDQVASHFAVDGSPDSWWSRQSLLLGSAGFTVVMNLFVAGLTLGLMKAVPIEDWNLAHRDFWLANSDRRERIRDRLNLMVAACAAYMNGMLALALWGVVQYSRGMLAESTMSAGIWISMGGTLLLIPLAIWLTRPDREIRT